MNLAQAPASADADALEQAGIAHFRRAAWVEAANAFAAALQVRPDRAGLWNNYAAALSEAGHVARTIEALQRALQLDPDSLEALNNLGAALDRAGRPMEAAAVYRRALARESRAAIWSNLGNVLKAAGHPADAVAAYREAIRLEPDFTRAHSNLLLVLNYLESVTPEALAEAHRAYGRRLEARIAAQPAPRHAAIGARLTVGFVSADLYNHPVGRLLLPVLQQRTARRNRWVLYAQNTRQDTWTEALRQAADGWCDIAALDDDALQTRLADDGVDVLVDLGGHTAGNRLPFFARHAVAVQVAWMGYACTTGLSRMDYLIADAHTLPVEDEALYTERIVRLPGSYIAFAPPATALAPSPPPCLEHGRITFGSFNNVAKLSERVLQSWARILLRVPHARLLFKNRGFAEAGLQQAFRTRFESWGVPGDRVLFEGEAHGDDYYGSFARVDIALDPFPFPGLLTSLDTLWMGVPLVTMRARAGMLSRHADLLTAAVGEGALLCADAADYEDCAVALANDSGRLRRLRARLRAQLAASPLFAPARLAGDLDAAFSRLHGELA